MTIPPSVDVSRVPDFRILERDVLSALDISLPGHRLTADDLFFVECVDPADPGYHAVGYKFNRRGRRFLFLRELRYNFDISDTSTREFNETVNEIIRSALDSRKTFVDG